MNAEASARKSQNISEQESLWDGFNDTHWTRLPGSKSAAKTVEGSRREETR